jgi:hypothetical protein
MNRKFAVLAIILVAAGAVVGGLFGRLAGRNFR